MAPIPRYCNLCGAANAAESEICSACQHPLDIEEVEPHSIFKERYRVLAQVGSGGFGAVYRAEDTHSFGKIVAIKQINLQGLSPQKTIEATDAFNREVRLLSGLQHPSLPRIHDTFTDAEHWYLVMDFIEGETLEAYLNKQDFSALGLPIDEALDIGLQLCDVLNYLHRQQPAIIFRDLKPGNIMRTPDGRLRLIDFGIARHFTPGKPRDTIPFGSPGYAAPEQYGKAQTTPRADIYSLGALLHYLLSGEDPAEMPFNFAALRLYASPERAALDRLIQRMVAVDEQRRPASISEVQEELERIAATAAGPRVWRPPEQPAPQPPPPDDPIFQEWRRASGRGQQQVSASAGRSSRRAFVIGGLVVGGMTLGLLAAPGACQLLFPPRFHGTYAPLPDPAPELPRQLIYHGHSAPVTSVAWSPNAKFIASASADKTVLIWRATDGFPTYTFYGYQLPVTAAVWSQDNMCIASCGDADGTVQVWEAKNGHMDATHRRHRGRVLALAWGQLYFDSGQISFIVSGGEDTTVQVWDANSGDTYYTYRGHTGSVKSLLSFKAFDGNAYTNLVASASADKTVQVWHLSTSTDTTIQGWLRGAKPGKPLITYTGHTAAVNALALYNDQDRIASASDDGTVQIWSIPEGQHLLTYRGHSGKVNAVAWLPGSTHVVSGGEDTTVQVWDSLTGKLVYMYKGHPAPITTITVSPFYPDRVISGSDDGRVYLWTIPLPT
jgi:hypothetical protein